MNIKDLLAADHVIAALRVSDKTQLFRELSHRAARSLSLDAEAILGFLETREALGSTGIGQGIAVPHACITGLSQFFGLFARLEQPIEFDAIDERRVDLVFLLLTPDQAVGGQLTALAAVSRRLRNRDAAAQLRAAETSADLYEILTNHATETPSFD